VGVAACVERHLVQFSACSFLLSIGRSHLSIAEPLLEVADSLEQLFNFAEQCDDERLYRFFIIEVDLIHVKADKISL
jgi:hypothetical protein